jgi:hypothetical protein
MDEETVETDEPTLDTHVHDTEAAEHAAPEDLDTSEVDSDEGPS